MSVQHLRRSAFGDQPSAPSDGTRGHALIDLVQARSDEIDAGRPRGGPAVVLVVDDYDLLAGSENPVKGLTGAIAHGRDLDFHVVIARRVAGLSRASFEPFLQALLELRTQGLVLSGDRGEGPVLDGYRACEQPPGRGLLVRRGRAVVVTTVLAPPPTEPAALHAVAAHSPHTERETL